MYQDVYSEKCSLELGDEMPEALHGVEPHAVVGGNLALGRHRLEARIKILTGTVGKALLILEEEGDVVDAGRQIVDVGDVLAENLGEMAGGVLHAVAEPDRADFRRHPGERPHIDRHRVDVLQHQRVRADLFHVAGDRLEHGNGPQTAEDAADAERIGDGLPQAVALGHLEIGDGRRLVAADLHHQDDEIRALQRLPAVGRRLDPRPGQLERFADALGDDLRGLEPLVVDVEQGDGQVGQTGACQHIAEDVLGKNRAAGADKANLGHFGLLRACRPCQIRAIGACLTQTGISSGPAM